jgi:hypothetical protein
MNPSISRWKLLRSWRSWKCASRLCSQPSTCCLRTVLSLRREAETFCSLAPVYVETEEREARVLLVLRLRCLSPAPLLHTVWGVGSELEGRSRVESPQARPTHWTTGGNRKSPRRTTREVVGAIRHAR